MKLHTLAIVVFFQAVFSCKENPSPAEKSMGHDFSDVSRSKPAYDTAAHNGFLLEKLLALQNNVSDTPWRPRLVSPLLQAAFDPESGCFYVVGKGIHSADLPEASRDRGRKIASSFDGKRWALYCKAWSQGDTIPFGKPLSGKISYSKVVFDKVTGDTLFQLLMVPAGSILLE